MCVCVCVCVCERECVCACVLSKAYRYVFVEERINCWTDNCSLGEGENSFLKFFFTPIKRFTEYTLIVNIKCKKWGGGRRLERKFEPLSRDDVE